MSRVSQSPDRDVPKTDLTFSPPPLRSTDDDFDEFAMPESGASAREGLPPSYKMRADRHYIDRMSESVGVPVRMIPVDQFEEFESADVVRVVPGHPLAASIALHGVLQPLIVVKNDGRYKVIAGRQRLAAACTVGLNAVPCLVYDVGEGEADALSAAANVRGGLPEAPVVRPMPVNIAGILQEITADLIRLDRSAALLRHASGGLAFYRSAVDLIAAQTWRTSWVANATALILGEQQPAGRPRPLAAIVERVTQGFESEMRLCGGELQTNVVAAAGSVAIDGALGESALTGAILTTLGLLQDVAQPVVEIRAVTRDKGLVALEVCQQHVPLDLEVARGFTDVTLAAKGQLSIGLAGYLLREVSTQYRGSAELFGDLGRGSVVRFTFRV
jgi:ParB/Sulfiredoxin domain